MSKQYFRGRGMGDLTELRGALQGSGRLWHFCPVIVRVGSSVVPGTEPKDHDFVAYVHDYYQAEGVLLDAGFEKDVDGYDSYWGSYRLGSVNVILTDDIVFAAATITGGYLSSQLELVNREDRVSLYACLRGERSRSNFCAEMGSLVAGGKE